MGELVRRVSVLAVLFTLISPIIASLSPTPSDNESKSPGSNTIITGPKLANVIDPGLDVILNQVPLDHSLDVIIQFSNAEAGELEADWLLERGFTPLHSTWFIPGILATGTADQILGLRYHPRLKWVEWNAPMKNHMNLTNEVIHALDAWDRKPMDADGSAGPTTDGSGVSVIVLDSGIDATHPDLDYEPQDPDNPSLPSGDDKVIYNAKLDQGSGTSTPNFLWVPAQNTDTTSGHGTHCAGTVAGNGDASAGDVLGVAPGAWLIGLSMGDGPLTIDEYTGLEYAAELTSPGSQTQKLWNIRVVTNSWGPGFPFDSLDANDLSVQAIEKLVREHNVAVVFANGNDGGDGSDDRSNIFAKVPAAIGVAASTRDGAGMADFSSRGDSSDITTWPDVSAPGVDIWSAAARASMIGSLTGIGDVGSGELDYWYLAISGTSMATPHVAGILALMWQVAPGMRMSNLPDDLPDTSNPMLEDPNNGIAPPAEAQREIHESEAILKLTSRFIDSSSNEYGLADMPIDHIQGYGLVNAEHAVALARTLQQLRDPNGDGVDDADVSVLDAHAIYLSTLVDTTEIKGATGLVTEWTGDYASINNDWPPQQDPDRRIWIPEGAYRVRAVLETDLSFDPLAPTIGNVRLRLDQDGDGAYETEEQEEIILDFDGGLDEGEWWQFSVIGTAAGFQFTPNPSTNGGQIPYKIRVEVELVPGVVEMDVNQSRGWQTVGEGQSMVEFERIWVADPAWSAPIEEPEGIDAIIIWLQEHAWVPIIFALLVLILLVGMNEKTQHFVLDMVDRWRYGDEAWTDEGDLEDDVLDAMLVPDG